MKAIISASFLALLLSTAPLKALASCECEGYDDDHSSDHFTGECDGGEFEGYSDEGEYLTGDCDCDDETVNATDDDGDTYTGECE